MSEKEISAKDRFKTIRHTLNLSQKKMAEDIDISYIMVQNYEYGKNPISESTLLKLRNKYNVNPDWLMNGTGSMFLGDSSDISDCISIPYFKEVSAAAGSGALVYDEKTVEYLTIPSTLVKITHSNNISIINAVGDSMYPLIDNNDFIIVDLSQKQFLTEGIYVIRIDDTLLVKKLQKIPNGVILVSENPQYKPIELTTDNFASDNIAIIGKVVSVIKNFGREI